MAQIQVILMLARRAAYIATGRAQVASDLGPHIPHYTIPVDAPFLYKWVPGSLATFDGVMVLQHVGGEAGAWHLCPPLTSAIGTDLGDANVTITLGEGLIRFLPATTLTENRELSLSATNAAEGITLTIVRHDVEAFTLTVKTIAGTTLATFPASKKGFAEFIWHNSSWQQLRAGELI